MRHRVIPLVLFTIFATTVAHSQRTEWTVWHQATTSYDDPGTELRLSAQNGRVMAFAGPKQVLDIDAPSIAAVASDDQVFRPLRDWLVTGAVLAPSILSMTARHCSGGFDCVAPIPPSVNRGVGFALAGTLIFGVLEGTRIHHAPYVGLFWRENGVLRDALFRVEKSDRDAILDTLSRISGKPLIDLAARREALRQELSAHAAEAVPVTLDHRRTGPAAALPAGQYRLIALPRGPQFAELFAFRGNTADLSQVAAQWWADVVTSPTSPSTLRVLPEEGEAIQEIAFAGKNYHLRDSVPEPFAEGLPPAETAIPVLTVILKGRTSQVSLVTYNGQRAFRFPVQHTHGNWLADDPESCAGNLYITADRVIFDSSQNLHGDRDPFDLPRSEILELHTARTATDWATLHVKTASREYRLIPYFGVPWDQMGLLTRNRVRQALDPELSLFNDVVRDFPAAVARYYRPPAP